MDDTRSAYSVRTLADRWSCSAGSIRKLIKDGKLASFHYGNLLRITAAEVDRYEGRESAQGASDPLARETPPVMKFHISKLPDWPAAMKRKTAAAYLDMSEAAFEREIIAGRMPAGFIFGGREHWHKAAIDRCLERITGGYDDMPDYRRDAYARFSPDSAAAKPDHIARFEERRRREKSGR
ncbi:MAG: helix-turn-helix domain-containing protein [Novosphingobium sp.]